MTEEILVRPLGTNNLFRLWVPPQSNSPVDGPDGRVGSVNPTVHHRYGYSGSRGSAPRPVLINRQINSRYGSQHLGGEGVTPFRP